MHICEIINQQANKKIVITKSDFSDGNNYYLTMMCFSDAHKYWYWNDTYQQYVDIHSLNEAKKMAKAVLS